MPRLKALDPAAATGKSKELLDAFLAKKKRASNMLRTMANSPAVLEGYLALSGALAQGSLEPKLREALSLDIAQANACDYCLSAHHLLGRIAGLSDAQMTAARGADSEDPKHKAALAFARRLVESRGEASDEDVSALRRAGFSDGEIAEIVANVALNVFTNYFNRVADTEVDFPKFSAHATK